MVPAVAVNVVEDGIAVDDVECRTARHHLQMGDEDAVFLVQDVVAARVCPVFSLLDARYIDHDMQEASLTGRHHVMPLTISLAANLNILGDQQPSRI